VFLCEKEAGVTDRNFPRLSKQPPAELCAATQLNLRPESEALLRENLSPPGFLSRLIMNKNYSDAVGYLARALPKREAVWWGCVCVREAFEQELTDDELRAVMAAEAWVRESSEERARTAAACAQGPAGESAAGMLALAARFAAQVMSSFDGRTTSPPSHVTGAMVGGAVVLSAVAGDPLFMEDRYRNFLAKGVHLARGQMTRRSERSASV